jgi:uncharacterized membrane protein
VLANRTWLKFGLLLVIALVGMASAFVWASSYRAPVLIRYGNGVGEVWCVFDRGLVQVELNHGRLGPDGWVINDFTGLTRLGWRELETFRPGLHAKIGLATWSYYLGADSGIVGKPVHGRVIFFPLAPAIAVGLLTILIATKARRRLIASAATA